MMLVSPPEERVTVVFRDDILPIIERQCQACHGGGEPPGEPLLSSQPEGPADGAYRILMTRRARHGVGPPFVTAGDARHSALTEAFHDPAVKIELTDEERRRISAWIDLGARWDGGPLKPIAATDDEQPDPDKDDGRGRHD
jgi:hypothetical protein